MHRFLLLINLLFLVSCNYGLFEKDQSVTILSETRYENGNLEQRIYSDVYVEQYYESTGKLASRIQFDSVTYQVLAVDSVLDIEGNSLNFWGEWSMDSIYCCDHNSEGKKVACGYYYNGYKVGEWLNYYPGSKGYFKRYYIDGIDTISGFPAVPLFVINKKEK